MTDEVKFTDEQWDRVAEAAEVFAKALEVERRNLRDVLTKNWAGDCDEGIGTMDNLRQTLQGGGSDSFAGAVTSEADYLRALAVQCRSAKGALHAEDIANADEFTGAQ